MSDKDSDKTKIKIPSSNAPGSNDVTRLAPKKPAVDFDLGAADLNDENKTQIATPKKKALEKKIPAASINENDKTRIAATNVQTEDRTRIAPDKKSPPASDATQFNPKIPSSEGRTRVAPVITNQNSNELNTPMSTGEFLASAVEIGEHGILKERFVLESVLGAGGMGIVYKAKDLLKVEAQDRDPYVAIKVLSEKFKAHPEAFISLQRESRKSQRIAHPNIVNVFDFDRDGDTVFMTMEFMDGHPLDELIRRYKSTGLPTDDAWEIIKGMSAALSYAHAEKIIHSDFKPGNVFVTQRGLTKVFDFGIARAVSQVEHLDDNPEDTTIFDAGNLGALTPAYASLEMMEGEEPDVKDDVYALGCVAYELFTGEHPYNKVSADEAERQGLKPKRIHNIKKYQWRAIQKAIAFRRKNRTESVDAFIEAVSPKIKAPGRMATVLALLLSVVITGYFLFIKEQPIDPYSKFNIRSELELKIKIDFYKENLIALLEKPTFTGLWEDSVWKDISDLLILTKEEDPWVFDQKNVAYELYFKEISGVIKNYKYSKAKRLIKNARRYTDNQDALDLKVKEIAFAIQSGKSRTVDVAKQNQAEMLARQKKQQAQNKKLTARQKEMQLFDIALANVNTQLKCQGRLNMRNFETAIIKLKDLDRRRFNKLKDNLIKTLAACITQTGKAFPNRAREAKKHSLRIFKENSVLAAIQIQSRDPCDKSLAGLGARGKRAICKDKIKNAGMGPVLVVIPGAQSIKTFAIGKYEVSINELNQFCKATLDCKAASGGNDLLPASKLDIKLVKSYLKWLSKQSGHKYRLPTKVEWQYAAKSRRKKLDANRNCQLSTRGIQKGGELVNVNIGKQNGWGLVNYAGNVQEWVYDKGRTLAAVGGSYKQTMDDCDITTTIIHKGKADNSTGFRVLREL